MKKNDILIVSNKKYGFNIAMLGFGRLASILGTNVFNFALRITSYNVCYTKLLRRSTTKPG